MVSDYVPGGDYRGRVVKRPKINQPSGYKKKEHYGRVTRHYCRNHNYTFYPESWVDRKTGKDYLSGYYDENGERYEDVAFKKKGKYDDVLCECEFCSARMHTAWNENEVLKCPDCGGRMKLISQLDEYTQDPGYTNDPALKKQIKKNYSTPIDGFVIFGFLIFISMISLVVYMIYLAISGVISRKRSEDDSGSRSVVISDSGNDTVSNIDIYGSTLYLDDVGDHSYKLVTETDGYEKKLKWDYGADSYYDPESDCYIWFNTDVSPNLWQYWYEGISSDYGDYGWMEYEDTGWYIEESSHNWVSLPENYDTGKLWHLVE